MCPEVRVWPAHDETHPEVVDPGRGTPAGDNLRIVERWMWHREIAERFG